MTLQEAQDTLIRLIHAEPDESERLKLEVELYAHELVATGRAGRAVPYRPELQAIHFAALRDAKARQAIGELVVEPLAVACLLHEQKKSVDFHRVNL